MDPTKIQFESKETRRQYSSSGLVPLELPVGFLLDRGRFEILARTGSGGAGTVYKARDLHRGDEDDGFVAIKWLHQVSGTLDVSAAQQEVARALGVTHPNIAKVHYLLFHEGVPFIVMEWLEGETLEDRLARGPAIDVAACDQYLKQLSSALTACHEGEPPLFHADIKPSNLFLTGDGIRLLDLGIAEVAGRANKIRGYTPPYASREQQRGEPVTARDDLFSLACVVFEMLTGDPAFAGREPGSSIPSGYQSSRLANLPSRYRKALAKALDLDPENRTKTVDEFWRSIDPIARTRRVRLLLLGILVTAGTLVATTGAYLSGKEDIPISEEARERALQLVANAQATEDDNEALRLYVSSLKHNPYLESAANSAARIAEAKIDGTDLEYQIGFDALIDASQAAPESTPISELVRRQRTAVLSWNAGSLSSKQRFQARNVLCRLPVSGDAESTRIFLERSAISCP